MGTPDCDFAVHYHMMATPLQPQHHVPADGAGRPGPRSLRRHGIIALALRSRIDQHLPAK